MTKKLMLKFGQGQVETILEALIMLELDHDAGGEPSSEGRKVLRNIDSVRNTIYKQLNSLGVKLYD